MNFKTIVADIGLCSAVGAFIYIGTYNEAFNMVKCATPVADKTYDAAKKVNAVWEEYQNLDSASFSTILKTGHDLRNVYTEYTALQDYNDCMRDTKVFNMLYYATIGGVIGLAYNFLFEQEF